MVKLGSYFHRQKVPNVRTPTVLQMEAVECGAACLGMILAYFGRWVPLTQLRGDCGVSRDGSKASNLLRAARGHGMVAKGFKKETAQLRQMKLPFVVFWNFNHYIVVEGFFRKRIRLNDPGQGRRYVTYEEFNESFTGVVLTFEPEKGFARQGTAPSIMRSLRERMPGTRSSLLFLFFTSLLAVLPSLLNAGYPRIFLDHVVRDELWNWLQPLLAAMACTLAFMVLLEMLYSRVALRLQARLAVAQSAKYVWHVLRLPVEFFALRLGIEVAARAAANDAIAILIASQLSTGILNLLMAAFYAVVMLRYDVLLTVFGIVLAAVDLGLVHWISRRKVELGRSLLMARGGLMGYTILSLQSIETIKAAGTESACFSTWAGYQARVMSLEQRLERSSLGLMAVPELLSALNAAALLCLGGYRVMQGVMSIGMFVTFQALMLSFVTPLSSVLTLGVDAQALRFGITKLDDVTDNAIDPMLSSLHAVEGSNKVHAGKLRGDLELRDVVFGYSQLEPPLLAGISLRLRPGMRIGVVGGSGSGKSTVARLVAGTHRAWSGEILFDGAGREDIDRQLLCGSIAVVDQDVVLFEGTIRDNIALWDESVDDAVIVQAARDAGIHDFITTLEEDYHHLLHDGGRNLSGGQRQRIEIARALLQDPSLLVLDEATSALDTLAEKQVMDAIARRGCACLVIAHRLSTIRDCDEIFVLQQGHIVQRGTHHQLAEYPGPYAALLALEPSAMGSAL